MMQPVHRIQSHGANAVFGRVVFDLPKAVWNIGFVFAAIALAPFFVSFSAVLFFIVST